MLIIDSSLFVGKGMDRECYVHPDDSERCIKVTVSGNHKQSRDEISAYGRLQSKNISWQHLARYHGTVQTDKGQGLIFDLIRDYDGEISKGLASYLSAADNGVGRCTLNTALSRLSQYLVSEQIILRDLNTENILFQKTSADNGHLVIVDGVGNNEFIPFSDYISWLARKKIARKWKRFIKKHQTFLR